MNPGMTGPKGECFQVSAMKVRTRSLNCVDVLQFPPLEMLIGASRRGILRYVYIF